MGSHLDIIGSVVIAGMIILNFAVFMGERQDSQIESTNKITAQTEMSDITSILRHDLRKVGFGCDSVPILEATATLFAFRADLGNDGKIDTIAYMYRNTSGTVPSTTTGTTTVTTTGTTVTSETLNASTVSRQLPRLYRIVNGKKNHGNDLSFVGFTFKYYTTDKWGALVETSEKGDIRAISVNLRMRSKMKEEGTYSYSQNEFTVSPKNL